MEKAVKKKAAKKRQPPIDPNLSAVAMIERSLRAHEGMPSPERIDAQVSAYMSAIGKKGGKASGAKRMENLTDQKRSEIALKAARARWSKPRKKTS